MLFGLLPIILYAILKLKINTYHFILGAIIKYKQPTFNNILVN